MLAVYAVVKLLAYSAWCWLGLRLARPEAASVPASLRLGAVRWCIGLVFGVAVFFLAGAIDAASTARVYFLVYTPVRAVEWGFMAVLVGRRVRQESRRAATPRLVWWCIGGMLVSFLTDLLSPEGLQSRFCVARCLC